MSRIIYKPTCSNCGEVIHGEVSSSGWQYKGGCGRGVSPTCCPNCGTYFGSIVMPCPTKEDFKINMDLPYENKESYHES